MLTELLSKIPEQYRHNLIEAVAITLTSLILILVVLGGLFWVYGAIMVVIVISARYQLLARIHGFNAYTGGMMLEDKFVNEYQYHIKKKGYKIKFFSIGAEQKLDFKTDASPFTKRWCKTLTLLAMMISPGWSYRDLEDEETPMSVGSVDEARAVILS